MTFAIFCAVFFAELLIFLFGIYFEAKGKKAELCAMRMSIRPKNRTVHTKKQKRIFYLAYHHRKSRVRKKNLKRLERE